VLAEVAFGEHGVVRNGMARRSHPWLLNQLRDSMKIAERDVVPVPATLSFLRKLAAATARPITAVAAIGTGNERLIVPEYQAITTCFAAVWPEATYEPFLQANLTEDRVHSQLCYELASSLIGLGESPIEYRNAAIESVESRAIYFDELLASL
jgi:hypothetical protein